jgi:superoxide dismutase, Cu-Zn family
MRGHSELQLPLRLPILVPLVPVLSKRALVIAIGSIVSMMVLAAGGAQAQVPPVGASADVRDATGRMVATAEFREGRGEALVTIIFPSPATLTGTHAVHIMEVGRCDPPDFLTAGNIFNPGNKKHGRQNPEGPMAGDLPNVNFTTGLTSYNTSAPGATLGAGAASLLGPNRTSVVIYSGEDDQLTDPDGKSGSRIACGVVAPAAGLSAQPVANPAAPVANPAAPVANPAAPVANPGAPVANPGAPVANPGAPRIASPVPVQPGVQAPAAQPGVAAQPPAAQPGVAQQPGVAGQPPAAQPGVAAQPPAAQPAVKPVVSPVVVQGVVPKPAVPPPGAPAVAPPVAAAASPTALTVAQPVLPAVPTVSPVAASQTSQPSGGLGPLPALLIAIVGVGLLGAGYLMRRRAQLRG